MKIFPAIAAFAILSSCGGNSCPPFPKGCGDTGGITVPSNLSSAPGEAALAAYLQASHQTTLGATDTAGNSYSLQVTSTPSAGTTAFNGVAPAYRTLESVTVSKNGMPAASNTSTSYYLLNPYVPLGKIYGSGSPYAVVISSTPFPATLNVGSSGPVEDVSYYHDSKQAVLDADETGTFSVRANDYVTLLMCLNFVIADVTTQGTADGLAGGTETDCYGVQASGYATLVSIALMVNGVTLNFK